MKTILTVLIFAASLTLNAQNSVVTFKFDEMVAIQNLDDVEKYNTYRPIWNDEGKFKVSVKPFTVPLHLVIHTEDNEQYNVIIMSSRPSVDTTVQWERKDMVVDLSKAD